MSTKEYDVICIGEVCQDILVTPVPKDVFQKTDTWQTKEMIPTVGGDAANEAVVLSRLGSRVALVARVDGSSTGDMVCAALQDEGIDTSRLIRPENPEDCRTFTSLVMIHEDGNHCFIVGPGHGMLPRKSDLDMDLFKKARAVSAASLFALGELDTDGIGEVFETAKEAGAVTFADLNFDLEGIGRHAMDYVFPLCDFLLPSEGEAQFVTGEKDPEKAAQYLLDKGAKNVVIKLGGDGCYFRNAEESFYVDPFDVDPLDTTGCGDNFMAAFIYRYLQGKSSRDCLEFASAAGAMNTQKIGAHMAVDSEQQIEAFMKTAEKRVIKR